MFRASVFTIVYVRLFWLTLRVEDVSSIFYFDIESSDTSEEAKKNTHIQNRKVNWFHNLKNKIIFYIL